MRRFVSVGVLVGAMVACGSDEPSTLGVDERDASAWADAADGDSGAHDGGLDASSDLDGSASDASSKSDASYFVNDAGETVQECAKSSECPTGYRCEADGARKSCVEATGFGESCGTHADCAGTDAPYCFTQDTPSVCLLHGCAANPGLCPSGWLCCEVPATTSFCLEKCIGYSIPVLE